METAIEVRDLVVERGKRRVLHGISCTVPAGSVTGLLGPSSPTTLPAGTAQLIPSSTRRLPRSTTRSLTSMAVSMAPSKNSSTVEINAR